MTLAVPLELVAGVVRQLRFAERALLADEPALAQRYLDEADVLLSAARHALPPAAEPHLRRASGS